MRALTADTSTGFGSTLAAAGRSILADARGALANPKLSDGQAVHEVRKAFKRWRALLRLLDGPLGARARPMRLQARTLMRALTGARDAQSALDALAGLRKAEAPLAAAVNNAIRQRLIGIRDAAEKKGLTKSMRQRLARYLDSATRAFGRWPIETIAFNAVADAVTRTYRRTRRLLPDDWRDADTEHLHELRRRVVEHRHHLDIIAGLRRPAAAREVQSLRNRLGACQDLAMLAELMAPHRPLARWRSRVTPAIEARRADHLKSAAKLGIRLFSEKPKAFRRRVGVLGAARRKKKR